MKHFFQELFEYSHHYNQKLADIFNDTREKVSEKSVQLFSHILNAHQIWNNRIALKQEVYSVWQTHQIKNFGDIDKNNFEHSLYILNTSDFNITIGYRTSKGLVFNNSVRDILFHIINHSTYHRAQIATEFRNSGIEPLVTDYIFFKR
ncbi:MAG: DinB family protein [Agriterribacter sp.]